MASPTQWLWVWVVSGSWWWTGRPGVLQFMRLQRVGHDWVTELNWVSYDPYRKKKKTKDSSNSSSLSKWICHLRYTSKHTCMQTQINNTEKFPNILLSLIHFVFSRVSAFRWLNQTQTRSFISVGNKSLFWSFFKKIQPVFFTELTFGQCLLLCFSDFPIVIAFYFKYQANFIQIVKFNNMLPTAC